MVPVFGSAGSSGEKVRSVGRISRAKQKYQSFGSAKHQEPRNYTQPP